MYNHSVWLAVCTPRKTPQSQISVRLQNRPHCSHRLILTGFLEGLHKYEILSHKPGSQLEIKIFLENTMSRKHHNPLAVLFTEKELVWNM